MRPPRNSSHAGVRKEARGRYKVEFGGRGGERAYFDEESVHYASGSEGARLSGPSPWEWPVDQTNTTQTALNTGVMHPYLKTLHSQRAASQASVRKWQGDVS